MDVEDQVLMVDTVPIYGARARVAGYEKQVAVGSLGRTKGQGLRPLLVLR